MASIDLLDIVSLLLGIALAMAAASTIGRRRAFTAAPLYSRVLLIVGAGLLLGYAVSEITHAIQTARG